MRRRMSYRPNTVTKVSRRRYGGRIKDSISGVVIGVVIVLVAFPILYWNEGRAVQTAKSLEEGAGAVVSVSSDSLDPRHEGDLVHMTGEATTSHAVGDPTFGIEEEGALKLRRVVEMYQWRETSRRERDREVGGSETTVTTYEYNTSWSQRHIDSRRFEDSYNYQNPAGMPFEDATSIAAEVEIGPYKLSETLVQRIQAFEKRPFTNEDLESLPSEVRQRAAGRQIDIRDGVMYASLYPGSLEVGDFRVRFEVVRPQTVSLIAKQMGADLVKYQTDAGDPIAILRMGTHDADTLFEEAMAANKTLSWVLRLAGFILMFVGFGLLFKPLAVVADVLPFLGSLMRLGTGLLAGILAVSLSLITIAVGWFVHRPLVGALLLVVAIGLLVSAKVLASKKPPLSEPEEAEAA